MARCIHEIEDPILEHRWVCDRDEMMGWFTPEECPFPQELRFICHRYRPKSMPNRMPEKEPEDA